MPAHSNRKENGAAEPSMIGTSGPSTSISALSTPAPARAAIRCSIVPTRAEPSPIVVQSLVSTTRLIGRGNVAAEIGAAKDDAMAGGRGQQSEADAPAGMNANADAGDAGLQRALRPERRNTSPAWFGPSVRSSALIPSYP